MATATIRITDGDDGSTNFELEFDSPPDAEAGMTTAQVMGVEAMQLLRWAIRRRSSLLTFLASQEE